MSCSPQKSLGIPDTTYIETLWNCSLYMCISLNWRQIKIISSNNIRTHTHSSVSFASGFLIPQTYPLFFPTFSSDFILSIERTSFKEMKTFHCAERWCRKWRTFVIWKRKIGNGDSVDMWWGKRKMMNEPSRKGGENETENPIQNVMSSMNKPYIYILYGWNGK